MDSLKDLETINLKDLNEEMDLETMLESYLPKGI